MKTFLKAVGVVISMVAFSNCAEYPPNSISMRKILHEKALTALEEGRFVIRASELYFPAPDDGIKYLRDSICVAVQDDRALIRFSDEIFALASLPMNYLTIENEGISMEKEQSKKAGDMRFALKMKEGKYWEERLVMITLYEGSNKCYTEIYNGYNMSKIVGFTGHVLAGPPYKTLTSLSGRRA